MPDILAVHAAVHPDRPALRCGEEVVTYRGYDEDSNRAARALLALGVRPGDRVAIMSFNSIDAFTASAGIRKATAVGVPINFRLRGEELAYIVRDSGARVVCAGPDFVEHVEAATAHLAERPVLLALGDAPGLPGPPAGWLAMAALMADQPADAPAEDAALDGAGRGLVYTSGP